MAPPTGFFLHPASPLHDTGWGHVEHQGRLRALATTGPARSPLFPDLPTVGESGMPGFVVESWYGLLGPAGLPAEVVARIQRAVIAMLADPEMRSRLSAAGLEPLSSTPEEFAALIRSELERWGPVVRASGARVE